MRTIKFRGKLSHSGKWIIGNLVIARNGNPYIIPSDIFEADGHHLIIDSDSPYWVTPETVGQFTGLNDKNGKCIFEGDIYKRNTDLYLVTCTTLGGFLYRQIYDSWTKRNIFGKMEQSWLSAVECYKYEIIDNIIDNPELIKTI
jgi:uncharacterized phage protein (TIGR01671 family)